MSRSNQLDGSGFVVTVKYIELLLSPEPVETSNCPEVAPDGIVNSMDVGVQESTVMLVPLSEIALLPCDIPNPDPKIPTCPPIEPVVAVMLLMTGTIVKVDPLLVSPDAFTTTLTAPAKAGAGATTLVALQLVGVAAVPPNETVLDPCVAPKFDPLIVTEVPTGPDDGERLLMLGEVTVTFEPLLARLETKTVTLPLDAPTGTGTTMLVALQLVGVAAVPLNETVLDPCVEPKFVPVIVIETPYAPEVGDKLEMLGGWTADPKL